MTIYHQKYGLYFMTVLKILQRIDFILRRTQRSSIRLAVPEQCFQIEHFSLAVCSGNMNSGVVK